MSLQSEYYNSLVHHGVKGQKWGVRRFETKDGHLTPAGKDRYDDYDNDPKLKKKGDHSESAADKKKGSSSESESGGEKKKGSAGKTLAIVGGSVAAAALAAYGAKKTYDFVRGKNTALHKSNAETAIRNLMRDNNNKGLKYDRGEVMNGASAIAGARARNDSFVTAVKNVYGKKKQSMSTQDYYEYMKKAKYLSRNG